MRESARAAFVAAAILAGLAAVGADGWPGEASGCIAAGDCYCEAFTGGLVEQPANTFSNLGFVLVGLWVLAFVGRPARGANLIADDQRITRLYGWIAIGLGVGSMLFHGTMTEWGGWADLVSMYTFITFFLLYELRIKRSASAAWLLRSWTIANMGLAAFQWFADNGIGKWVFGALIVATLVANRLVVGASTGTRPIVRDQRWYWIGLSTYVAGNIIWTLSRTGAAWCNPNSLLQGHAVWHITSAGAVAAFFLYLRSEHPGTATVIESDRRGAEEQQTS